MRPLGNLYLMLAVVLACSDVLGQTSNPFPSPIVTGAVVVNANPFATLPSDYGTSLPNQLTTAPDGRIFVIDQDGQIFEISADGGSVRRYLVLGSVPGVDVVREGSEQGLQSLAFHPDFYKACAAGYGKFYTVATVENFGETPDFTVGPSYLGGGNNVLLEWQAADPTAPTFDPANPDVPYRVVLRVNELNLNHNMGLAAFNPNAVSGTSDYGKLYIGVGDGGGEGDPLHLGQNKLEPYGKILRIDPLGTNSANGQYGIPTDNPYVHTAGVLPEIWAMGLRNPQRFSWDTGGTKQMYVADIGQGTVEEIDQGIAGANYGWSAREGSFVELGLTTVGANARGDAATTGYTYPIAEYDHSEGLSITAGFVYRATDIPALEGKFLFGDIAKGRVFFFDADHPPVGGSDGITELRLRFDGAEHSLLLAMPSAFTVGRADLRFGQDLSGRIFLLTKDDSKIRVLADPNASPTPVPTPTPAPTPIPDSVKNVLSMHSEAGDVAGGGRDYYYVPRVHTFGVWLPSPNSIEISIDGNLWWLSFVGPDNSPLTVQTYSDAVTPYSKTANGSGIEISETGSGNPHQFAGNFNVKEITYSGNIVSSFWATFTQYSNGSSKALTGEIRYDANALAALPTPTPCPTPQDTPTPIPTPTATPTPQNTPTPTPAPTPTPSATPVSGPTGPPTPAPAPSPTPSAVQIFGKAIRVQHSHSLVLSGTVAPAEGIRAVEVKVGRKPYQEAWGTVHWDITLQLPANKNVVLVRRVDRHGHTSAPERIVVIVK